MIKLFKEKWHLFVMLLVGVYYFEFFRGWEYYWHTDTIAYVEYLDLGGVMPLYPAFISLIRNLVGESMYLQATSVVQGVIAMLCCMVFTFNLKKQLSIGKVSSLFVYLCTLLGFAYTLPEHVASHEIMTESMALPIFYIFMLFLINAVLNNCFRSFLLSVVVGLVLVVLRSQMLFLLVVLCGVGIYLLFISEKDKERRRKRIKWCLGLCGITAVFVVVVFVYRISLDHSSGEEEYNSQFLNAFWGKALYVMQEDDYQYISNPQMSNACRYMYEEIRKTGYLWDYAPDNLTKWEHVVDGFNDNMIWGNKFIYDYYTLVDVVPREILSDTIDSTRITMIKTILAHNLGRMFMTFLCMLPSGLISMIFIQKRSIYLLCHIIAFILYMAYGLLIGLNRRVGQYKEVKIAILVLLVSIANLFLTNLIHFGIQRYLMYTFGLHYVCLFIMLISLLKKNDIINKVY